MESSVLKPEEKLKRLMELRKARLRKAFYRQTPLRPLRRDKLRKGNPYCERHLYSSTSNNSICFDCRKIYNKKVEKCVCGSTDIIHIGPIARLPRKNAHKKKWEKFWRYCDKSCAGGCR